MQFINHRASKITQAIRGNVMEEILRHSAKLTRIVRKMGTNAASCKAELRSGYSLRWKTGNWTSASFVASMGDVLYW